MPAGGARAAASRSLPPVGGIQSCRCTPGMTRVTHQTGSEGRLVKRSWWNRDWILNRSCIWEWFWIGAEARPVIMMSAAGGMEIEEVAARTPELIVKEAVDPAVGLQPYQTRNLAFGVGLTRNCCVSPQVLLPICIKCSRHMIALWWKSIRWW